MSTVLPLPAMPPVRLFPLGDAAVVLEFGTRHQPGHAPGHRGFRARLRAAAVPGLREVVPAFTTLTVYYDPWLASENGQLPRLTSG